VFRRKKTYTVYTAGAPVLKKKAREIKKITPEIVELAENMVGAMKAFDGIGLAGPQYGKDLRIVVLDVPSREGEFQSPGEAQLLPMMPMAAINPEIVGVGEDLLEAEEGCLSVPEIWGSVVRPATVRFKTRLLDGSVVECDCGGLLARCIQHELDHLDGILFVDRMSPEEFEEIKPALQRLETCGAAKEYKRKGRF
jgi:peptide deformylase